MKTIMILGSYHMDNPGADAVNFEADDVLTAKRQRELQQLIERLARFKPTKIAVEADTSLDAEVNAEYHLYVGLDWLLGWYKRNFKIFVNLTRITESDDDRVLLMVSAGHVFLVQLDIRDCENDTDKSVQDMSFWCSSTLRILVITLSKVHSNT